MKQLSKIKKKIFTLDKFEGTLFKWKEQNKKIVFTNGCFDIIHRGHIEYLSKAADLGDKLIIGLNTDSSVRKLKGDSRPILDEETRAIILSSLVFVDAVIYFNDDTPIKLIEKIIPDFLVKGGDYEIKKIVGYDIVTKNNGKVLTLDFVENFSSTNIIKKFSNS